MLLIFCLHLKKHRADKEKIQRKASNMVPGLTRQSYREKLKAFMFAHLGREKSEVAMITDFEF